MAVQPTICAKVTMGSSDFAYVTSIRFNVSGNVQTYTASGASGHQLTLPGHISGELSFDVIYDPADDIFDRIKVNDQVTLVPYVDGTRNWSIPCRISDFSNEINVSEGSPPTVSFTAQTHGQFEYIDGTTSPDPC